MQTTKLQPPDIAYLGRCWDPSWNRHGRSDASERYHLRTPRPRISAQIGERKRAAMGGLRVGLRRSEVGALDVNERVQANAIQSRHVVETEPLVEAVLVRLVVGEQHPLTNMFEPIKATP